MKRTVTQAPAASNSAEPNKVEAPKPGDENTKNPPKVPQAAKVDKRTFTMSPGEMAVAAPVRVKAATAEKEPTDLEILGEYKRPNGMTLALQDIFAGLKRADLWWELAVEDLRQRYTRSFLGIFWLGASYLTFLGIYLLIFGSLSASSFADVAVYIALGFLAWEFISSSMMDGAQVFISSSNWIRASKLPFSTFVFESVVRILLHFFIAGIISFSVVVIAKKSALSAGVIATLSVVGAIMLMIFASVLVHFILGVLAARYRDLTHLVNTAIRVLFFLTPVIWQPHELGRMGALLATYNPLSYFIEILRTPLLTGEIPQTAWLVSSASVLVLMVFALSLFAWAKRRLVFWF